MIKQFSAGNQVKILNGPAAVKKECLFINPLGFFWEGEERIKISESEYKSL